MPPRVIHVALAALSLQVVLGIQVGSNFGQNSEVHDEEHLKQHLEDKIDVSQMTPEQQKFYYFSIHDLNKDNRIDGNEIMKSFTHQHQEADPNAPVQSEDDIVKVVDKVLKDFDLNGDGFIDYAEYYTHKQPAEGATQL